MTIPPLRMESKKYKKEKNQNDKCGCFWNGGHWIRLCDKHLEEFKKIK